MAFRRILAAAVMAASALVVAPAADADQADTKDPWYKIVNYSVQDDVWDQSNWDWDPMFPIVSHPWHGGDNQQWDIGGDNTFRDRKYGLCATDVNGTLAGRDCDGSDAQKWVGTAYNGYEYWLIESDHTGQCVTHNGTYKPLILAPCDPRRYDQRWFISSDTDA